MTKAAFISWLKRSFMWTDTEKGMQYHIWALMYVIAATIPDFIVSEFNMLDSQGLALAIKSILIFWASILFMFDLVVPAEFVGSWKSLKYIWQHKIRLCTYIILAVIFNAAVLLMDFADPYNVSTVIISIRIAALTIMFIMTSFFSYCSERKNMMKKDMQVKGRRSYFNPKIIGSLITVIVAALFMQAYLYLADNVANFLFPALSIKIVGVWLIDAPIVAWFLRHYSYRIHTINDHATINYSGNKEEARDSKTIETSSENNKIIIKPLGFIGVISLIIFGFTYSFYPGIALFNIASNYQINRGQAQIYMDHGYLQTSLLSARRMQVDSLNQYAYYLYQIKDFKGSKSAAENASTAYPANSESYLIDGYSSIQLSDYTSAQKDVNILKITGHPELGYWIQFHIDQKTANNVTKINQDKSLVKQIGVVNGLLPFEPKSVLTNTKGQGEIVLDHIKQADEMLLKIGDTALKKEGIGQGLTIAQELYSAWPTSNAETYAVPQDVGAADIWFASLHSSMDDFNGTIHWMQTALSINNALSKNNTELVNQALLAYTTMPFNDTNINSSTAQSLPDNDQTKLILGMKAFSSNKRQEAIDNFTEVVKDSNSSSQYAIAVAGLAVVCYQQGDAGSAIKNANLATQTNSNSAKAVGYTVLGNLLTDHKGDADEAISDFTKALQYNPNEYLAWYYIGNLYQEKKDYINAIKSYQKAEQVFQSDYAQGEVFATGAPSEGFGLLNVSGESGGKFGLAESGIGQSFNALKQKGDNK